VCLKDLSVSKTHCVFVKADGLLWLLDLGSTNGTRVNGRRIRRIALQPDDRISIAGCHFRVGLETDDGILPTLPPRPQPLPAFAPADEANR
jgi:pSer/pThr/pTyr-binding forkhead associated (FHA) protein